VVTLDWYYYEFESSKEPKESEERNASEMEAEPSITINVESLKQAEPKYIFQGDWEGRVIGRRLAEITLPDEIKIDEAESINAQHESQAVSSFLKNYSYYPIKFPFGIKRINWHNVRSFSANLTIENVKEPKLRVSMPIIFPTDNLKKVGEKVKEYTIGLNLSAKGPNTESVVGFSISTEANMKAQITKKINYDLVIPQINAYTNGNNDAEWIYLEDEAIGRQGQYRADMLIGFPKDKPKAYRVNAALSINLKLRLDPNPLLHAVPIKFEG
jgi:hypothetical protein